MHGVSAQLPLAGFVGLTLDQICIGQHQVQFRFGGAPGVTARISVEGGWLLQDAAGCAVDRSTSSLDRERYKIHVLLSRTISSFSIDPPHSFELVFDSGHRLAVYDDNLHYETFSVHTTDGTEIYI